MDSLPAIPLNVVAAATGHAARTAADSKETDASSFGQVLDNELAAITPHGKAPKLKRLMSDDAAADSEKITSASEDTQVLQAMLEATTVVPPGGMPVAAISPGTVKAGKDADAAHPHIAGARDGHSSATISTAHTPAGEAAAVPAKDETAEKPATPADMALPRVPAHASAAPAEIGAAQAVAASVLPAAPSATRVIPAEGTAARKDTSGLKATSAASATAETPASAYAKAREGGESGAERTLTVLSTPSDGAPLPRSEPAAERIRSDSVPASSMEKLAPDSGTNGNTVASSLDALSSAALMSKWTAGPQSNSVNAAHTPASARIDAPFGTDGWGEAFSQKVVWLVDRQQQSAELHVNPPHLGPVEVVLKLSDDGARIAFSSPHAAVRDAIDASLADLRNALAERGLSLGQALVSADPGTAREQLQGENSRSPQRASMGTGESGGVSETQTFSPIRRGLVDIFA
jgi:flagellar hook-length control protein FliK